jgi:hypothetical protein
MVYLALLCFTLAFECVGLGACWEGKGGGAVLEFGLVWFGSVYMFCLVERFRGGVRYHPRFVLGAV